MSSPNKIDFPFFFLRYREENEVELVTDESNWWLQKKNRRYLLYICRQTHLIKRGELSKGRLANGGMRHSFEIKYPVSIFFISQFFV